MFTPGPWRIKKESDTVSTISGNQWAEFATVYTATKTENGIINNSEEGNANARLISAAPEMYELLNKVYNLGLSSRYPELEAGIREMLNKIEGR